MPAWPYRDYLTKVFQKIIYYCYYWRTRLHGCTCEGQRATLQTEFSPSVFLLAPESYPGHQAWAGSTFTCWTISPARGKLWTKAQSPVCLSETVRIFITRNLENRSLIWKDEVRHSWPSMPKVTSSQLPLGSFLALPPRWFSSKKLG